MLNPAPQSKITTDDQVRALATVMRDKLIADARQAMKAARDLERKYDLPPAKGMGR